LRIMFRELWRPYQLVYQSQGAECVLLFLLLFE
jgi:hypothetical protein